MSDLWTAYASSDPRLAPFFAHRLGDWASVVETRRRTPAKPLNEAAVEELRRANAQWGVASRVVERAALLASPDTRVIATGQQAGLLGGPLYTLYKTMAVVRWADRIERDLGLPVLPVFWVASEDDDFDEIRSFRWQDAEGRQKEYRYLPSDLRPGTPIHDIPIEPHLRNDLAQIFSQVRPTEFTADLAKRVGDIAAAAHDLETFFIHILAWLLADRAPLFVSPRMSWVRQGATTLIERELTRPGESSHCIIETGKRLRDLGFPPQVSRRPGHINCFFYRDGLRHKVFVNDERMETIEPTGKRRTADAAQLQAQLTSNPASFGFNVVTRSIAQDYLLPTLAYVAGPGEMAYLAQMRGVYEFFGATMPMILPRPQVCLVEPRVERALSKIGLSAELTVVCPAGQIDSLLQHAHRQSPMEERLTAARVHLSEALAFIGSQVDLSDPAVARAFGKLQDAAITGVRKLAERQRSASLAHDAETAGAATTIRDLLWPDGLRQERALTVFFPFLNLFGTPLVQRLMEAIRLDASGVQPIVLSSLMSGERKP